MKTVNLVKKELQDGNIVVGCMVTKMRIPAAGPVLEVTGKEFIVVIRAFSG
jgi:hypothetical protein